MCVAFSCFIEKDKYVQLFIHYTIDILRNTNVRLHKLQTNLDLVVHNVKYSVVSLDGAGPLCDGLFVYSNCTNMSKFILKD